MAKLWSNTIPRPRTPDWPNDEELRERKEERL
jgi:hypothetical protein